MFLTATSDNNHQTIYLDHAAATPLAPAVLEAMLPHLKENYGNTSSVHHLGRHAKQILHDSKQKIAHQLDIKPTEIIFTGSGTESDNLAILGLARAHRHIGRHIITSTIEHKAVLAATEKLSQEGFSITYLPVDEYGRIRVEDLLNALRNDTILISIMYANNEIGTVQPISVFTTAVKEYYYNKPSPIFHTDACQAVGMLPIKPENLGVDAMTINSAKIYGPKGIGMLYVRDNVKIEPQVVGGGQENNRRAGTENIALAVGFSVALEHAVKNTNHTVKHLTNLRNDFINTLKIDIPTLFLNGHPTKRLPNNVHVCIPDVEGEAMLLLLDQKNICASTGSACSTYDLNPSHVLTAIGLRPDVIHGSLRFTLGINTTREELEFTAKTLKGIHKKLLGMSASPFMYNENYVKHS